MNYKSVEASFTLPYFFMNLIIGHIVASSVSFTGEFLPNFNLKNMISTYAKVEKNGPNLSDFEEKKIQISRIFMIGSSR
jgi:hypothetical protein